MNDFLKVGGPLPASIGRCADLYHDVRELRLAMEKEVAEIKARETEIHEHIVNSLSVGEDTGASGLRYRAQVIVKRKPQLVDYPIFWTWIRKNDFLNFVQRRINEKAVMEWLADNPDRAAAPGTEMINLKQLSVTKI